MNNYKINDKVKINNTNLYGKITRINNKNITILVNNKSINTNISNIQKFNFKENKNNIKITYPKNLVPFNNEIMLRHKTKDEAIFLLDTFLKEAIINKVDTIKIIHGKNGGIIRMAVHDYLKTNKNIESYRLGNYYEGQYGVTIAKLKK